MPDSSDEQRGSVALGLGGDDEQLGLGGARHERLDAVEHPLAAVAPRLGRRARAGRTAGRGSSSASAATGAFSPANARQVGRLLGGVAPQAERARDGARRERRERDAHVAVGERLGERARRHRGALGS